MSQDDRYKEIIKREMAKLKKPVKLKVFTCKEKQPSGSQIRECMDCNQFMALLRIYEENSNGMLTIQDYHQCTVPQLLKFQWNVNN